MNKKFFLVLLFSCVSIASLSQHELPMIGLEHKIHFAFLMPHHPHMNILAERHFPIYQLSLVRCGDFGNRWSSLYRYPLHGLTFVYSPLSSPKYLGFGTAILPYIQFNIIKKTKFRTSLFAAAGIGYIDKRFHIAENYKNQAIGSHLNASLMGQLEMRWIVSRYVHLHTGISILHFSNGKVKTPNLGINNLSIFSGISILRHHSNIREKQSKLLWSEEPKFEYTLTLASAIKQKYPVGGDYYLYSCFSVCAKKILNLKTKFGGGLEFFYDFSDKAYFESQNYQLNYLYYSKISAFVHYEFRFQRMSIFFNVGRYLYALENNRDDGMIYDRTGIQFYLNRNKSLFIALKKHFFKADAIELGFQTHLHKYKK